MGFIADLFGATNKYKIDESLPPGIDRDLFSQAINASLKKKGIDDLAADQATQRTLIETLQRDVSGTGPSVAQNQLRDATQQGLQNNAAQLAGVRGLNPAIAARLIAGQNAQGQQQLASQAAGLRAQEQLGSRDALSRAIAEKRAADVQSFQAETSRGQNLAGLQANYKLGAGNINSGVAQANANQNAGILGGIVGGAAQAVLPVPKGKAFGGEIPGEPLVEGDHPANDTVPAMLSPGEVVLPRTVAKDPNEAKAFVAALKKKDKKPSYGEVLERLRTVEGMFAGGRVGYAAGGTVKPTPAQEAQESFLKNLGANYLKSRLVKAGA